MKHRGTKILSLLLTLVMVLGLLPGMSLTAYAATETYTKLMNDKTVVKFNNHDWYIIADDSTATGGTVTLLAADTSFGRSKFHDTNYAYRSSTVKGVLDALTEEGGSFAGVKDAIEDTDLPDVLVTGAKLYLLSTSEAGPYANFNFTGLINGRWWLRTRAFVGAAFVNGASGVVNEVGEDVSKQYGVRPALRLNLSKVTFDSTSNTFSLKSAGYSVTLSGGANATIDGATSQTGLTGAMTTVTYTANSGNKFPETSELYKTTDGITVARKSDTVVTVSGKPTANVNITVPDAAAIPTYTVTYDPGEGGGTPISKNSVAKGSSFLIEAMDERFTAPDGKTFDYWLGSDRVHYTSGSTIPSIDSNLTLTAQWKDKSQGGGNQGGQNSQGGDVVFYGGFGGGDGWSGGYVTGQRAYRVSLAPMQGGSAILILNTGESGTELSVYPQTTVMVIPSPAPGYTLASIVWSLIDGSASYDITQAQNLVMPAMDAVVHVTFAPVG